MTLANPYLLCARFVAKGDLLETPFSSLALSPERVADDAPEGLLSWR